MTWFVVGPTVEVRETPPGSSAVTQNGRVLAVADVIQQGEALSIALRPTTGALDDHIAAEAYRLLARVCWRLTAPAFITVALRRDSPAAAALRRDGFEPAADCWCRAGAPFVLREDEKVDGPAHSYDEPMFVPWQFVPVDDDVLQRLVPELDARSHGRVLDLGCGYGKNTSALEALTSRLFAIDISIEAVQRCRVLASEPQRVIAASVTALPYRDASFDCVVDIGCIHCVRRHEARAAVREVARVIAPGGVLLSRIFLPRDQAWLAAQPFRASMFGYSADEAVELFSASFAEVHAERAEQLTYLRCTEPRR